METFIMRAKRGEDVTIQEFLELKETNKWREVYFLESYVPLLFSNQLYEYCYCKLNDSPNSYMLCILGSWYNLFSENMKINLAIRIRYLKKAVEMNNSDAMVELGKLLYDEEDRNACSYDYNEEEEEYLENFLKEDENEYFRNAIKYGNYGILSATYEKLCSRWIEEIFQYFFNFFTNTYPSAYNDTTDFGALIKHFTIAMNQNKEYSKYAMYYLCWIYICVEDYNESIEMIVKQIETGNFHKYKNTGYVYMKDFIKGIL